LGALRDVREWAISPVLRAGIQPSAPSSALWSALHLFASGGWLNNPVGLPLCSGASRLHICSMWRALGRSLPRGDTALVSLFPLLWAAQLAEASYRTEHGDADADDLCGSSDTDAVITAAHVRELETKGLVVIRDAFLCEKLASARSDVAACSGRLGISGNDLSVRSDRVANLRLSDGLRSAATEERRSFPPLGPGIARALRFLRGVSHSLALHDYAGPAERRVPQQVQFARYSPGEPEGEGGGYYRRHLDACTSSLSELGLLEYLRLRDYRERSITAILYLNDARWGEEGNAGSGGALRCWTDSVTFVDIMPRGGTLVIFDSRFIEHEVMPTFGADRFALTSWVVSKNAQ
jgi:hypothetical protein